MPDENKLKKLTEIGYRLQSSCGLCKHGRFSPSLDWGSCKQHTYEHLKHGKKDLSVHRAGHCDKFEFNAKKKADVARSGFLGLFSDLTEETE